jgi:hypothetical protein
MASEIEKLRAEVKELKGTEDRIRKERQKKETTLGTLLAQNYLRSLEPENTHIKVQKVHSRLTKYP